MPLVFSFQLTRKIVLGTLKLWYLTFSSLDSLLIIISLNPTIPQLWCQIFVIFLMLPFFSRFKELCFLKKKLLLYVDQLNFKKISFCSKIYLIWTIEWHQLLLYYLKWSTFENSLTKEYLLFTVRLYIYILWSEHIS